MKMSTAASMESGTSLSTFAKGMKRSTTGGRAECTGLRATPGVDDRAGPRRAGVDREGADQSRQDAAGPDGEEVAPGVDVIVALLGERARRRGASASPRRARRRAASGARLPTVGPRQTREAEVRRAACGRCRARGRRAPAGRTHVTRTMEPTSAMRAPGMCRLMRAQTIMTARTPSPISERAGLDLARDG